MDTGREPAEGTPTTVHLLRWRGVAALLPAIALLSGGLALAALGQAHDGLIVVITDDFDLAHRIESEIAFFLDGDSSLPVLQMPDWETLPYDVFSPHQDIVSERLAALAQLPKLTRGILVIPVTTAMHRLPPPSHVVANSNPSQPAA